MIPILFVRMIVRIPGPWVLAVHDTFILKCTGGCEVVISRNPCLLLNRFNGWKSQKPWNTGTVFAMLLFVWTIWHIWERFNEYGTQGFLLFKPGNCRCSKEGPVTWSILAIRWLWLTIFVHSRYLEGIACFSKTSIKGASFGKTLGTDQEQTIRHLHIVFIYYIIHKFHLNNLLADSDSEIPRWSDSQIVNESMQGLYCHNIMVEWCVRNT